MLSPPVPSPFVMSPPAIMAAECDRLALCYNHALKNEIGAKVPGTIYEYKIAIVTSRSGGGTAKESNAKIPMGQARDLEA